MVKKNNQLSGVKEIARRANVSIGTVDRVIHDRPGVSPKTRDKIKKIIKDINYRPNLLGRILASQKEYRFACLIPKVSPGTSFWEAPLKGIETAETEIKHYNVTVEKYFYDQDDRGSFVQQTRKILKDGADGILLAPTFIEESITFTDRCKKLNIPYVFIDSDIPDQPSLSYIGADLYKSGYLAANLASYLVKKKDTILIVNISTELEDHHHLLRKEEGFRGYFRSNSLPNVIDKIDISKTSYSSIKKDMDRILEEEKNLKLIFVTNSKVSKIARYLRESHVDLILIGYDFVTENIAYLEEDIIDFLICQKPGEQAYKGIMALHKHLILNLPVEDHIYMPIDILMKANYAYYSDYVEKDISKNGVIA